MSKKFELKPLTIGCDPELFLRHKGTMKLVSAHGLIPGTKYAPHKIRSGTLQVDGMAAEIGIDPAETSNTFTDRVIDVVNQLRETLPDYDLVFDPIAKFDNDVWEATPPEAKMLGCEPDYDAYTGAVNPQPQRLSTMCTAAGHLHLGWTEGMTEDVEGFDQHVEACRMIIKQLDYFVGVPGLYCDSDTERRKLYGKAGAMRVKPYGVEYRTPSNFWLKDYRTMEWIHKAAKNAFGCLMNGQDVAGQLGNMARDIINSDTAPTKNQLDTVYYNVSDKFGMNLVLPNSDLWSDHVSGHAKKAKATKTSKLTSTYKLYADLGFGAINGVAGGRGI